MSRTFIATVLAISTAIAGFSAAPARAASEDDIARLLAGAATIFIIGKAIESSRDRDRDSKKYPKKEVKKHYSEPKVIHRNDLPRVIPRNTQTHNRRVDLPRKCVRRIEGGRVNRVVMKRCLERNYSSARALPNACRMRVSTHRGPRTAYALPCLRHRGYTLARH